MTTDWVQVIAVVVPPAAFAISLALSMRTVSDLIESFLLGVVFMSGLSSGVASLSAAAVPSCHT
jgi:hypothetical protein